MLSSQVTELTGCGTADWPWLIDAGEGQRVNITLHDFSREALAATHAGNGAGSYAKNHEGWISSLAAGESGNGFVASTGRGNGAGSYATDGRTCKVYATIRDGSGSRSTTICGGRAPVTHVFLSTTSRVEIRLLQPTAAANSKVKPKVNSMSSDMQMPYFLLHYDGTCLLLLALFCILFVHRHSHKRCANKLIIIYRLIRFS